MLVWDLPEPAGRGPALNRERIVRAALAIADEQGPGSITMRRLAADVGSSTPMSLYRYVGSKHGIEDLLLDAVFGEIGLPDGHSGHWRDDLRTLAHESRRVLRRHPWFAELSHHRPLFGPNALRHNEWALRAVDGHGLRPAAMMSVVSMVFGYAVSYAHSEAEETRMRQRIGVRDDAELAETVRSYVDRIVADPRYPMVGRWITDGGEVDPDEQFELGLECLLDGIAARVITG